MTTRSAVTDDTWAGGIKPEDIHQRILDIRADNLPWVKVLQNEGGEHRLYGRFPQGFGRNIRQGFTSVHSSDSSPPDFNDVFDGIDEWLYARARKRFFFYIDLPPVESGKRSRVLDGFDRLNDEEADMDAVHRRIDFWLAQTIGILSAHDVLKDTAILLVGAPGLNTFILQGTTLLESIIRSTGAMASGREWCRATISAAYRHSRYCCDSVEALWTRTRL